MPNLKTSATVAVLAKTARILHENGQRTAVAERQVQQLAQALGVRARVGLGWDHVVVYTHADGQAAQARLQLAASPANVNMARVIATTQALERAQHGATHDPAARLTALNQALDHADNLPSSPTGLFVLAAVAGALALAVIFGGKHPPALALLATSAGLGAVTRRWLAARGANLALQAFTAALLAGLLGGTAIHFGMPSSLHLIAVCPCMILVPGPHILNGALDLLHARISLGLARLAYAAVVLCAIATGAVLGLTLTGSSLPPDGVAKDIPAWLDVAAASVAAACYSVYFSSPYRLIGWAMLIGAVAHLSHWLALDVLGLNALAASWLACLVAGTSVVLLSRKHLSFAAVGFAAVVALVPGLYVFRWVSALLQLVTTSSPSHAAQLQLAASQDLYTALLLTAAMVAGLVLPILLWEAVSSRHGLARFSDS